MGKKEKPDGAFQIYSIVNRPLIFAWGRPMGHRNLRCGYPMGLYVTHGVMCEFPVTMCITGEAYPDSQ